MISLISEITDAKGSRASRGWLFFDAECSFCTALARRVRPLLEPRGYGLAALQDARVRALLAIPEEELLAEMRLLTADGKLLGGADAIVYLTREIWWARPLYWASRLSPIHALLHRGYHWVAARRRCAASQSAA